ncbi:DNA (cytosine-5-)-methyltransferase [Nostocoides sp. F2B08]|uniref:DNA cytosine methyltransferase n=1 Tax=Nostocoides sp. F2B08 TaxID=2653936 RepID=UPI001263A2F6|nr:DNA cytosine methyltransferase [Tetrasphaera sp. F2B08]KAB7745568.1 DNA (cytosine-5-)-methyltransferase [Tetrasphaera sp. F2B08]
MSPDSPPFTFVDLFAGVGGFHAALGAVGGKCVYAVEKDPEAAAVYERNWRRPALGDIVNDTDPTMLVPAHDVLAAGFPCQPFSKSGLQHGMDEARGTLFWNILRILEVRRPTIVMLENVRNIYGPRHKHEWAVIIRSLRELGYQVSSRPIVFSPHLLPPERGGRPQIRERVFIMATYFGVSRSHEDVAPSVPHQPVDDWSPSGWNLDADLPIQSESDLRDRLRLNLAPAETTWVEAWNDFVTTLRSAGVKKLPGFPVWVDAFIHQDDLVVPPGTAAWKATFLRKNSAFYTEHRELLEAWLARWDYLRDFPPSRRKFEWQAQEADSLSETVMHLRPSGLRVKQATYVPALVAITQTSILGDRMRRISPREAARLQGLPEWFDFGDQPDAATYKQMGNGVNVGAAYHVFREHVLHTLAAVRRRAPGLAAAVERSHLSPDTAVERHWDSSREVIVRRRSGRNNSRRAAG